MQTGNLRQTGKNRAWKLRYRKVERRDGVVKKHRYDVLIGDASLTFEQAREIANKILRPINIQSATVRGKKTASTILKAAQKNDKKQRGALCSYCNIALGYAKEDENTLFEMILYIRYWRKRHAEGTHPEERTLVDSESAGERNGEQPANSQGDVPQTCAD